MEIVCFAVTPFLDLTQNIIDVLFTTISLFGINSPDVSGFVSGIIGCTAVPA
ncbi:MAG TPA: hypothetical protein VNT79_10790 [Phycisphaerae bacterium]|nr:hypothetical protein [Phycisphaerae bacterium]